MSRLSIRKQLLTLFVPFLCALCMASAAISFWLVSTFAGQSFDRDLVSSADSVVGRLRVKDERIVADLPPAALAILKHVESDKFYYRVLTEDGRLVSGDANLPPPSTDLKIDVPKLRTATIGGKSARLAEIRVAMEEPHAQSVVVQVAETTKVRSRILGEMLLSIALPQLLVIIAAIVAVWYGVAKVLTPLRMLQQQLETRSHEDLRPLSDDAAPAEVLPLVETINRSFERSREELKAQQRFIANAAHQLRTPLAGLKTYSSIGIEMSDANELKHIVNELDLGVDRASRMVSQLLALARTDVGDPAITSVQNPIDLNFVVSDVVSDLIDQAVRKNVAVSFESSESPAIILAEVAGLRHLVANLLENAILYTPTGGTVTARVRMKDQVVLSIVDSGCGIPTDERDRVFERFYRVVGTEGNGSGLGLAIVKEVANAHRARVAIESGPGGQGTLVVVEFPKLAS